MNKNQFLNILSNSLKNFSEQEKKEIMYDYEEHFRNGVEEGLTEEEIADELGDPSLLAKQYKANFSIQRAEQNATFGNVLRAIFAAIGLGFFDLFLLPLYMMVVAMLIGFFCTAAGITVAGVAAIFIPLVSLVMPAYVSMDVSPLFIFFMGTGVASLGLLCLIGLSYVIKYFFILTVKYLKWNFDVITKR